MLAPLKLILARRTVLWPLKRGASVFTYVYVSYFMWKYCHNLWLDLGNRPSTHFSTRFYCFEKRQSSLKNSLSYNSTVVSRSMGLALEIQHLFSFKQRGLIIADSLSCLILRGFYWHGCKKSIRSGTYKRREGGNRASVRKKIPRGNHMPSNHHTSHKPQEK